MSAFSSALAVHGEIKNGSYTTGTMKVVKGSTAQTLVSTAISLVVSAIADTDTSITVTSGTITTSAGVITVESGTIVLSAAVSGTGAQNLSIASGSLNVSSSTTAGGVLTLVASGVRMASTTSLTDNSGAQTMQFTCDTFSDSVIHMSGVARVDNLNAYIGNGNGIHCGPQNLISAGMNIATYVEASSAINLYTSYAKHAIVVVKNTHGSSAFNVTRDAVPNATSVAAGHVAMFLQSTAGVFVLLQDAAQST